MKTHHLVILIQALAIIAMFALGQYYLPALPEQVPSHWNFTGEVDSYMPATQFVLIFPAIALGLAIFFPILAHIDPRHRNYRYFQKPWFILQNIIILFFAYMYFITLYISLNPTQNLNPGPFIIGGIGILFIIIGNYLGKIRQNYFVGIKTPWALNNADNWNKTHRLGGWLFLLAGIIFLLEAFLWWHIVPIFITTIAITVLLPFIYSYLLYRHHK